MAETMPKFKLRRSAQVAWSRRVWRCYRGRDSVDELEIPVSLFARMSRARNISRVAAYHVVLEASRLYKLAITFEEGLQ